MYAGGIGPFCLSRKDHIRPSRIQAVLVGMGMMNWKVVVAMGLAFGQVASGEDEVDPFDRALESHQMAVEKADFEYRKDFARALGHADKVEVFIVKFDGLSEEPEDPESPDGLDRPGFVYVSPYSRFTPILERRVLLPEQRADFLKTLASAISKEEVTGGAFCHYPIHGVRAWLKGKKVYEASFCWRCRNFGFKTATGEGRWLDTTVELRKLFHELLPIPAEELERAGKVLGSPE